LTSAARGFLRVRWNDLLAVLLFRHSEKFIVISLTNGGYFKDCPLGKFTSKILVSDNVGERFL